MTIVQYIEFKKRLDRLLHMQQMIKKSKPGITSIKHNSLIHIAV